jgi:hypothetical protein
MKRFAVIPAEAGIHDECRCWIPAFAGMTVVYGGAA